MSSKNCLATGFFGSRGRWGRSEGGRSLPSGPKKSALVGGDGVGGPAGGGVDAGISARREKAVEKAALKSVGLRVARIANMG